MNVSDLGQDLEHCQQLHRQLRKLPGVWAGVRCPASGNSDPVWALEPEAGPRVSSVLTTCACLDRLPHLAKS